MRIPLVAVLSILAATPVVARDTSPVEQPRCWLGSMGYSPGATIRAGTMTMVCTAEFTWAPTTDAAAGCVHGGQFYAVGAIQNASTQQQALSTCQHDGSWAER